MSYVLAVQTPAYMLTPHSFAIESAFARHLLDLKLAIGERYEKIVVFAPRMADEAFNLQQHHLSVIHAEVHGIEFVSAYQLPISPVDFWIRAAIPLWKNSRRVLMGASILHSGMSFDPKRPSLAIANLVAWLMSRPIVFFVDIDYREDPLRYLKLKKWGLVKYLLNRFVAAPFRAIQIKLAVRFFQLVLLKGESLVRDFGNQRPHVKNFYDTVHSRAQVLTDEQLAKRCEWLGNSESTLNVCYFGRVVWSKGVDRMIAAIAMAKAQGCAIRLTVIGDGDCRVELENFVKSHNLTEIVQFLDPVIYGDELFAQLDDVHLMLATPLIEDTPRAVFDAMARGVPTLAYDISYFRDLAQKTGSIALACWADDVSLCNQLVRFHNDRSALPSMAVSGIEFAVENTQEVWLQKRVRWTHQFLLEQ